MIDAHSEPLTWQQKVFYHQLHPAKLAGDISASIISAYLMWQHEFVWAMVAAFGIAMLASAIVTPTVDIRRLKNSRFGRYVNTFMTRPIEAWRFGGQIIMWIGAWYHWFWLIPVGALTVLAAWMSGMLPRKSAA
jgi:hypothetical protein